MDGSSSTLDVLERNKALSPHSDLCLKVDVTTNSAKGRLCPLV